MAANAGQVLTYECLLERVWGRKGGGDLRPMCAVVVRLRRRLGENSEHPTYVFNEPRVGYWVPAGEGRGEEPTANPEPEAGSRYTMNNRTERGALVIGAVVGMIMAAAGWVACYLSGAEVLLLDGNFSFIGVLATLLAVVISLIKTRASRTYPFGQFAYEPTYSLFIGLLTVGVIVVAVAGNATKIVDYFQGERFPAIDTSVILVYTVVMAVLCFGLAGLFASPTED